MYLTSVHCFNSTFCFTVFQFYILFQEPTLNLCASAMFKLYIMFWEHKLILCDSALHCHKKPCHLHYSENSPCFFLKYTCLQVKHFKTKIEAFVWHKANKLPCLQRSAFKFNKTQESISHKSHFKLFTISTWIRKKTVSCLYFAVLTKVRSMSWQMTK